MPVVMYASFKLGMLTSKLKNISWELAIPKLGDFPIDKLYIGSQLNQ